MNGPRRNRQAPYDEINITPMLDLAYVLLVIFIIMMTAAVQGVRVEMPVSKASTDLHRPGIQAITVTEDGQIYFNAYAVTKQQLARYLSAVRAGNPAVSVVFKGDADAPYAVVMDVMETLRRARITDVGLATSRRK